MWRHNQNRVLTAIHGLWESPAGIERAKQYADRDPEMARALEEIADQFTPTGFLGEAEQQTAGFGVGDALAKADAMREAAIKDPLNDPSHPEYERVTAEYLAYHARALGPRGREVVAEVRR